MSFCASECPPVGDAGGSSCPPLLARRTGRRGTQPSHEAIRSRDVSLSLRCLRAAAPVRRASQRSGPSGSRRSPVSSTVISPRTRPERSKTVRGGVCRAGLRCAATVITRSVGLTVALPRLFGNPCFARPKPLCGPTHSAEAEKVSIKESAAPVTHCSASVRTSPLRLLSPVFRIQPDASSSTLGGAPAIKRAIGRRRIERGRLDRPSLSMTRSLPFHLAEVNAVAATVTVAARPSTRRCDAHRHRAHFLPLRSVRRFPVVIPMPGCPWAHCAVTRSFVIYKTG